LAWDSPAQLSLGTERERDPQPLIDCV